MDWIYKIAFQHLYNVTWKRINITALEFTCEVACRTSSIDGCTVLLDGGDSGIGYSSNITGMIEAITPRYVTVVISNLDPMLSYSYSATVLVVINMTIIHTYDRRGKIPAAICKNTLN